MPLDLNSLKATAQRWLQPIQPLIDAVQLWLAVDGMRMSAAMTFYGLLSLSPLVLLIVALLGWWVDRSVVESTLLDQVRGIMGERGASVVEGALASAQQPAEGRLASAVALVLLMSGATGVFVELQNAIDKLWQYGEDDDPPPKKAWWKLATLRLRGLAYVLVVGFLLLTTMALSAGLKLLTQWAGSFLRTEPPGLLISVLNECIAFGLAVVLFVGLMRIGTGRKPRTRHLVFGAVLGATLFTISKQAMAWYLANAAVVSAYGAAGSIVVVLMWIYVTSAILLLSASSAKALDRAQRHGAGRVDGTVVQPAPQAPPGTFARPPSAGTQPPRMARSAARVQGAPAPQWPRSPGAAQSTHWPEI